MASIGSGSILRGRRRGLAWRHGWPIPISGSRSPRPPQSDARGEDHRMHCSMWTYPWDVQDIGINEVIAELGATGIDTISLATSYHAGRFLQPRSPRRKAYFP